MTGSIGEGHGESGSSLMKEKSGNLLTSISATLSGDDERTKLSGVSHSDNT